jgi:hypothetical protein
MLYASAPALYPAYDAAVLLKSYRLSYSFVYRLSCGPTPFASAILYGCRFDHSPS